MAMYYIYFLTHKFFNLICYFFNQKFKIKFINYYPIKMDIEPTTGCNFRCTMCEVSQPGFIKKNMTLETFERIIKENKQLIRIRLQGLGEPFINKNFIKMITIAQKYFIKVDFVTNGSLLNDKNINELFKLNNLNIMYVSVDGSSSKVFEQIRVGSNYNKIMLNLKNFFKINRMTKNKIKTKAMMLVQKSNKHQVEDVIKNTKSLGFNGIDFQIKLTGFGNRELDEINQQQQVVTVGEGNIVDKISKLEKKYGDRKFRFNIITNNLFTKKNKCNYPWQRPFVDTGGYVVPCCMIANSKTFNLGNIYQENFKKIWNGQKFKLFRKSIENHELHDFCKTCYMNDN